MDKNWSIVRGLKCIEKKNIIDWEKDELILTMNIKNIVDTELSNIKNSSNIKKINTCNNLNEEECKWLNY